MSLADRRTTPSACAFGGYLQSPCRSVPSVSWSGGYEPMDFCLAIAVAMSCVRRLLPTSTRLPPSIYSRAHTALLLRRLHPQHLLRLPLLLRRVQMMPRMLNRVRAGSPLASVRPTRSSWRQIAASAAACAVQPPPNSLDRLTLPYPLMSAQAARF